MFDIHQPICDDMHGDIEWDQVLDYIVALMTEFDQSPEAQLERKAQGEFGWTELMLKYAINHLGVHPAKMSRSNFDKVLYVLFPRKVSSAAESAPTIIAELRAFWGFVHRQYGLPHARQILDSLDDDAVIRLRNALSNPTNFGLAKSMFMLGARTGFDMSNQEGVDQFVMAYNSQLLRERGANPAAFPPSLPPSNTMSPRTERLTREDRLEKRAKRKRERQSRKRHRR